MIEYPTEHILRRGSVRGAQVIDKYAHERVDLLGLHVSAQRVVNS